MHNNLFIPSKITVGFTKRSDTYTGKLAFIVYKDEKGNIKKEKSFNGWIDKSIEVIEIDNKPESGFILNRDIHRGGYHFSSGRNVIRVYDSRDFEFEITPSNLIGLLANSDCSKGEILEKCVYAWNGTELILLPVNSEEYTKSIQFTQKQGNKFSVRDLVKGYTYANKKDASSYIYIGHMKAFNNNYLHFSNSYGVGSSDRKKEHVFYDTEKNILTCLTSKEISHCISENVFDEYAELLHYAEKSMLSGEIKRVFAKEINVEKVKEELENITFGQIYLSSSFTYGGDVSLRKSEEYSSNDFYEKVKDMAKWHNNSESDFHKKYKKFFAEKNVFNFEDQLKVYHLLNFKIIVGVDPQDNETVVV